MSNSNKSHDPALSQRNIDVKTKPLFVGIFFVCGTTYIVILSPFHEMSHFLLDTICICWMNWMERKVFWQILSRHNGIFSEFSRKKEYFEPWLGSRAIKVSSQAWMNFGEVEAGRRLDLETRWTTLETPFKIDFLSADNWWANAIFSISNFSK